MCLDSRYDKKTEAKMIAALPDEFTVYKVVFLRHRKYCPAFYNFNKYKTGVNVSPPRRTKGDYKPYYHSYKAVSGAKRSGFIYDRIIKCKVRKKDITAIGKEGDYRVIVSRKIIMPSPSDKSAVVKETK